MSATFAVTPPQAYAAAGSPHGLLGSSHGRCANCSGHLRAYSAAGVSELAITTWCEPCFDYLVATDDDREAWMDRIRDRRAPVAACAPTGARRRQHVRACRTRQVSGSTTAA